MNEGWPLIAAAWLLSQIAATVGLYIITRRWHLSDSDGQPPPWFLVWALSVQTLLAATAGYAMGGSTFNPWQFNAVVFWFIGWFVVFLTFAGMRSILPMPVDPQSESVPSQPRNVQRPELVLAKKTCGSCHREIPLHIGIGDCCPHCRVIFTKRVDRVPPTLWESFVTALQIVGVLALMGLVFLVLAGLFIGVPVLALYGCYLCAAWFLGW